MGLLRKAQETNDRFRPVRSFSRDSETSHPTRICRFEQMEPRRLLSAGFSPIQVGAVYLEDGGGEDLVGDLIEITFTGGAPGTQLSQLVVNTDKRNDGELSDGDPFFDTAAGQPGAFAAVELSIHERSTVEPVDVTLTDGGTMLVMTFAGFHCGDRLLFSVDVDEGGYPEPNAVAEGKEFEGSRLSATFVADHYFDAGGTDIFLDEYDFKLAGSGLELPPDDYVPPGTTPRPVHTAGAVFPVMQTPLPITLAGTVFEDIDLDNAQDPGEPGLAGVEVLLGQIDGGGYAATAFTNADGDYRFDDLLPGTYEIVEVQPDGYYSVGASAGTVAGVPRGVVTGADVISQITLLGGEDSIDNDFGEVLPVSIGGRVHADTNGNCVYEPHEEPLAGVTVHLLDASGQVVDTTQTDSAGEYLFADLWPGIYGLREEQPEGYLDGADHAGSAGGSLLPPDSIIDVELPSGTAAVRYDFCEIPPASIGGRVHVDTNGNCIYELHETPLAGVTIHLLDARGQVLDTTQTDSGGEYLFSDLRPGVYGIREVQPEGYFDGADHVGSAGGSLLPPDSIIDVELTPGTTAVRYDFCEIPPASISGYVYVDDNNSGVFDHSEVGIAGVELALLTAHGVPTGRTAVTDAAGFYRFEDLMPGTYGVAEAQPDGYFDGLDTAGSAGGVAHNPGDRITGAPLKPGTDATDYNFGELRPASISGRVHAELNGDCVVDPGEPLLAGVTVYLLDAAGFRLAETTTDQDGEYLFSNLEPGTYGVEEIQPDGYLDGPDHVGSAGGRVEANDRIADVSLGSGVDAVDYDFCEVVPATISGYVFQDGPTIMLMPFEDPPDPATVRNGQFTPDDAPIAGVVLRLGDGTGAPLLDSGGQPIVAVTNASGYYEFTMLEPGLYTILEEHPEPYVDSVDTPGTNGGIAVNPHQEIDPLILSRLTVDPKADAILHIPLGAGDTAAKYNFSEVRIKKIPWIIPPPPPPEPPPPAPVFMGEPATPTFFPPPAPIVIRLPWFYGSGSLVGYTWHLSVVNAGRPRRNRAGVDTATILHNPYFEPVSWTGTDLGESQWIVANSEGVPVKTLLFGLLGGIPVTGDFNGDGIDEVGVFIDGQWFIDLNGDGVWDGDDFWAQLGDENDLPVVGDWDGDGKADIGIFGPAWVGDPRAVAAEPGLPNAGNKTTGRYKNLPPEPKEAAIGQRKMKRTADGRLRSDLIDHVFHYGNKGDRPVAGDFNGDGVATIGIFRNGTWFLDVDGDGRWSPGDALVELGREGDIPVVGDFTGDGIDDLGVYRGGTWHLDTNGNRRLDARDKVFELGGPNDKPAVGDFNGDGIDEIAVYQDSSPQPEQQAAQQVAD